MEKLGTFLRTLHDDRDGAAFIEYSVLLGVILAASIAVVAAVGGWAANRWSSLNANI